MSKWYSHGAAGFKAAAPDPREPSKLPRLRIKGKEGPYNFLPLAERLDVDHLLAALRANREEWKDVMPKGDNNTTYKVKPWNHLSPTRISVSTSLKRLRNYLPPPNFRRELSK